MKELTLDEAIRLHKELYLTMSKVENYDEFLRKNIYELKRHCLELMGFVYDYELPRNYCFFCEYAHQQRSKNNTALSICDYCPLPHSCMCMTWKPYKLLSTIFGEFCWGMTEITDKRAEVIRNACIEISEVKIDMKE